jgi:hypothetical protein
MKKVLVGGLLAGSVLFVWGWLSHEVLPLGEAGLRSVPQAGEAAIAAALRGSLRERALYILPGMDRSQMGHPEARKAWLDRYLAGPSGVLAVDPNPGSHTAASTYMVEVFGKELASNLLAGFPGALLFAHLPASIGFKKRVALAAALGLFATLEVEAGYWNWFGFPTEYFLAQVADHTIGWLLAGTVLAWVGGVRNGTEGARSRIG